MYKIDEIMEIANLPSNSKRESLNENESYDRIHRFYKDKEKLITPYEYTIKFDGEEKDVRTALGGVPDRTAKIREIKDTGKKYSNYSKEHLRSIGFDTKSTWNGPVIAARYNYKGVLQLAETNYYTTSLFSNILFLESFADGSMDARKKFAEDVQDFPDVPWFTTGGSVGGLIINEQDGEYKALIGVRSDDQSLNPGRYSIVPNAKMKPNILSESTKKAVQKVLREEVLGYESEYDRLLDELIDYQNIMNGWNLRNTEFLVQYLLEVKSEKAYDQMKSSVQETDNEFSDIKEIDLSDPEEVVDHVDFEKMSPTVIPLILESIKFLSENTSKIDYDIMRKQS